MNVFVVIRLMKQRGILSF